MTSEPIPWNPEGRGANIRQWIDAGLLPPETVHLLFTGFTLAHLGAPSSHWAQLRAQLRVAADLVAGDWGEPGEDPDLDAFRRVDRRLASFETHSEDGGVEGYGYRFNRDSGLIETPTERRPRRLFQDLVRAGVRALLATSNSEELREALASEFAPFFPSEMLGTSKGSPLYNAVDNALRGR